MFSHTLAQIFDYKHLNTTFINNVIDKYNVNNIEDNTKNHSANDDIYTNDNDSASNNDTKNDKCDNDNDSVSNEEVENDSASNDDTKNDKCNNDNEEVENDFVSNDKNDFVSNNDSVSDKINHDMNDFVSNEIENRKEILFSKIIASCNEKDLEILLNNNKNNIHIYKSLFDKYVENIIIEDNLLYSTYNKLKLLKKYNYVFDEKTLNIFNNLSFSLKIS